MFASVVTHPSICYPDRTMGERRTPGEMVTSVAKKAVDKHAETAVGWADAKLRESVAAYDRFRSEIDRLAEKAKPYLDDPDIPVGTKAAIRTVLNAGIAIGDFFPGYGLVLSGGADAAKMVAKAEYKAKRLYVRWIEKGNPDDVKMSSLDLTPDVKLRWALGSELLEFCAAGFLPTHAVEGGMQLYHDWPRMKKAVTRVREIARQQAEVSAREAEAAQVFDVELEPDEEEAV